MGLWLSLSVTLLLGQMILAAVFNIAHDPRFHPSNWNEDRAEWDDDYEEDY